MPRALKQFLYRYSWLCVLALSVVIVAAYVTYRLSLHEIMATWAAMATAFYFFQKQQIEELTLFERLFADFNQRYGELNGPLQALRAGGAPLSRRDSALLEDYFNLCGEEYFYFDQGVIDSRVWAAWCRGMLHYLEDPRIAEFWAAEEAGGSYYGLTRGIVEDGGAGRPATAAPPALDRAA